MPKKHSIRVKHQDLEDKMVKYKKLGIRVFTYEKVSNPRSYELHMVYKKIFPQPENEIERELLRTITEDLPELRFETWDMSRRDEQQYARKVYMLVAETGDKDKLPKLADNITEIEKKYSTKKEDLQKKIVYSISD